MFCGKHLLLALHLWPDTDNIHDKAALIAAIGHISTPTLIAKLATNAIAVILSGALTTWLARAELIHTTTDRLDLQNSELGKRTALRRTIVCGAALLLIGIANSLLPPHPMWFIIANAVMYIPGIYAGYLLGLTMKRATFIIKL